MNDLKGKMSNFFASENKKVKIIMTIGAVGMILILISSFSGNENKKTEEVNNSLNYSEYTVQLEKKLTDIISNISGVGQCKVMITLENSSENVYATDSEFKNNDDTVNQKDEYVIYDSKNGETPVLIKEYFPQVMGVTVVCSGGDNIEIREKIIDAVTALFNISANRVSVSKIKS
ncbi:MAG: hypothetical protein NC213_02525 [Acetobacter sp.]|nr:hypothetical protein [Bacteroides sp.]MCM1340595.1 hypothetical protein [Acetobacter sp.]MCM1433335.1 hypothetical protein [Clostridiales bacterium]